MSSAAEPRPASAPSRHTGPARRAVLALASLALIALLVWLYENASLHRLRERFVPEMRRLTALRDGLDELTRGARSRQPGVLADWAWRDLEQIRFLEYDVLSAAVGDDAVEARVTFTAGGTRPDGFRLERTAVATVVAKLGEGECLVSASTKDDGWQRTTRERSESFPRFRDATAEASLGAPPRDPERPTNRPMEGFWPGSGAAVLDYDGDGFDDLFVGDGRASILYRGDGCGHFRDVTEMAGLGGPPIVATGVVAADLDGDGREDVFVTDSGGPSRLLRNRGDGTFEDVTALARVGRSQHSRSAAVADVNGDGWLDIFVCQTAESFDRLPGPPFDAHDVARNLVFVSNGDGTFTERGEELGVARTRGSLTAHFSDLDGDGWTDLAVTNELGQKQIFRNEDGRRFVDVAKKAGAEDPGHGMAVAIADYDGDARLDLYFTGTYTQWGFLHDRPWVPLPLRERVFLSTARDSMKKMCRGNSLLLARGDHFEDVTAHSGAGKAGWCWTAVPGDLDNDGAIDLYCANGLSGDGRDGDRELELWWETLAYRHDAAASPKTFQRPGKGVHGSERNRLFRNLGDATFEERGFLDGVDLAANGRAALFTDFDGDGSLDIYVRSVQNPETLYLGTRLPGEHYLELSLAQPLPNAAAIGARVTVTLPDGRALVQELQTTSGYLASGSKRLHFGLGAHRRVRRVSVRWPDRTEEAFEPPAGVDGLFSLERGTGTSKPVRREPIPF